MCLNGALCLLVDAVAAARPRTRSDRPPGSTISEKSRLAFEAATAVVVEALPFFQSPEREVSRTREGVPSHLSSARAATLVPSRAPYTPRASADRPDTAAESLARSDSSADAAEPRFVNTASISASAFFLPSSSASSAALRLTSSLARPSLILPSASARARACCTRDSRSLLYFSVARRSASIAAAARLPPGARPARRSSPARPRARPRCASSPARPGTVPAAPSPARPAASSSAAPPTGRAPVRRFAAWRTPRARPVWS